MQERCDIAVIGAGAAGLMAGIWAGRTARNRGAALHVMALDGAKKLGAKILVAGGGRCNVTHDVVDETAYAGSTRPAIRKVLGRFTVAQTVQFFRDLGVDLKREETGKLFPTTDDAHTVLDALLRAARESNVSLIHPWRIQSIERTTEGFTIRPAVAPPDTPAAASVAPTEVLAHRVILAAGGQALPRSGSDGHGYMLARALGHSIVPPIPALVPLTLPREHFLCQLSGITIPAALEFSEEDGSKRVRFADSTLLTHFGLSGPAVLDISRYYLDAYDRRRTGGTLTLSILPAFTTAELESRLQQAGQGKGATSLLGFLMPFIPERLARALCTHTGLDPSSRLSELAAANRRKLAVAATTLPLPVTGSRGFTYAEVTAGGVPLSEINLATMESRVCPGLHLCGEICDVDGRIGGYNFQWAWASGHIAGSAAAQVLRP